MHGYTLLRVNVDWKRFVKTIYEDDNLVNRSLSFMARNNIVPDATISNYTMEYKEFDLCLKTSTIDRINNIVPGMNPNKVVTFALDKYLYR